jgi:iron complex outermembrane recepter protein
MEASMMAISKMTKANHRHNILALLCSTVLAAAPAYAQVASTEDSAPEDIIITATKRSESLQKVPLSIQALGSEKLEQQQVSSSDDVIKLLPSVSFQSAGPGQSQFFFRGISSGGDGQRNGPLPATGLYIDETPVSTIGSSLDLHIYDMARIEALSGPQGTLFGASSLSGTLRLITNKPDTTVTKGAIDLQLNKFDKGGFGGSAEGYYNLPLSDKAALRVVGFYRRDAGYIDNIPQTRVFDINDDDPSNDIILTNATLVKQDFNNVETYGGRAALKIDLDDNWTVTPSVIYQQQLSKGSFLFDPKRGDLAVSDFLPSESKDRWYQAALTIEGKIGNWDLVYSGGYFGRKLNATTDYSYYTVGYEALIPEYAIFPDGAGGYIDPTQSQTLADKFTKLNQELRVTSPSDARFRLTAGFFLQRQTDRISADYDIKGVSQIPQEVLLVPAITGFGDNVFRTRANRIDRDYAAFTEFNFDITDQLTLTAGIRAFMYKNTVSGFSGTVFRISEPTCFATTDTNVPCNNITDASGQGPKKAIGSGETHKVNLSYKATPDILVYATYSTGFRPGGINRRASIIPYKPDTLTNYEIGWKTSLFDRQLRFNGAAFYENWKDFQFGLVPVGQNGLTNTYNAGDARIFGIEADFALNIGGLTLSGGGTYVDAKTTTDLCQADATGNIVCVDGQEPAARKGTRLPVQPKFKGNLTARYAFDMGSAESFLQATVNHQGGTRAALTKEDSDKLGFTKGFRSFDFSAGTQFGKYSLELFLQNAFDKRGQLSIGAPCATTYCGQFARIYTTKPRLFGIKLGTDF